MRGLSCLPAHTNSSTGQKCRAQDDQRTLDDYKVTASSRLLVMRGAAAPAVTAMAHQVCWSFIPQISQPSCLCVCWLRADVLPMPSAFSLGWFLATTLKCKKSFPEKPSMPVQERAASAAADRAARLERLRASAEAIAGRGDGRCVI